MVQAGPEQMKTTQQTYSNKQKKVLGIQWNKKLMTRLKKMPKRRIDDAIKNFIVAVNLNRPVQPEQTDSL